MSSTVKRCSFLIEESVSKKLAEFFPVGKRSQVVNEALRKELELIRRKKAVSLLLNATSKSKRLSTREIVSAVQKDRRKHR
jgi:hypothetical protein